MKRSIVFIAVAVFAAPAFSETIRRSLDDGGPISSGEWVSDMKVRTRRVYENELSALKYPLKNKEIDIVRARSDAINYLYQTATDELTPSGLSIKQIQAMVGEVDHYVKTLDHLPIEKHAAIPQSDWGDIVAGRIAEGAKTTTSCHDGKCSMITTIAKDDHGVMRQTIETGEGERWICTYDMPPVNVRLCQQYPDGIWRAEKLIPSGQMKLVGSGTIEDVYDSLGWPHRR